jgi:hypothetical protein
LRNFTVVGIALVVALAAVAMAAQAASEATMSASAPVLVKQVKQYDTTWTFAEPVRAGQFVTGDWWVAPNEGQKAVTVVSVDPAPVKTKAGKLINGSVVNPKPGFQCLDERAYLWKGEQTTVYPTALKGGESLVSAVSYPDGEERTLEPRHAAHVRMIKYVAVLTCLDQPAAATDFRPSFTGSVKTIYSSLKLHRELLPNLPVVGAPPDIRQLAAARFSRPWVEWPIDWAANSTRGEWEANYGREKAPEVGAAVLTLCLDSKAVGGKEPLILGLTQAGIDLYGTLCAGGRWPANGGHLMGRKLPILFAGLMLGDSGMLGIGQKYAAATNTFQEDAMAFIVTQEDLARHLNVAIHGKVKEAGPDSIGVAGGEPDGLPRLLVLKGNRIKIVAGPGAGQVRTITSDNTVWARRAPAVVECKVSPNWDKVPVAGESEYQVLGYTEEDLGHARWGGAHAAAPQSDNPSNDQPYGAMNKMAWPAEVLAARILGLKDAWNQPAVFLLEDEWLGAPLGPGERWVGRFWGSYGDKERPFDVHAAFIAKMWETYRPKYGEAWKAPEGAGEKR